MDRDTVAQRRLHCRVRTLGGHKGRVGTMAWSSHVLSTGSRDRSILQRDIRAPEEFQTSLKGHRSEVRMLKSRCFLLHHITVGVNLTTSAVVLPALLYCSCAGGHQSLVILSLFGHHCSCKIGKCPWLY